MPCCSSAPVTPCLWSPARRVRVCLSSAGSPGEPVVRQGPIVMNTAEELTMQLRELQEGTFIKDFAAAPRMAAWTSPKKNDSCRYIDVSRDYGIVFAALVRRCRGAVARSGCATGGVWS